MSFPSRVIRTQTPHALQSSLDQESVDSNNTLFQDLDNHHSDNEDDQDEDKDRVDGREQSDAIINLNRPSSPSSFPRFAFLSTPSAPAAAATAEPGDSFALLANNTSKRVRMDPTSSSRSTTPTMDENNNNTFSMSTSSPSKRVRFDESKNRVHWHNRNSSVTPPGSPVDINLKAQPLVSALLRRPYHQLQQQHQQQSSSSFDFDESFTSVSSTGSGSSGNLSPEKFTLSLDNTSQEVMDFASSLTRLMGGGDGGNGRGIQLGSQDSDTSSTTSSFSFGHSMPSSSSSRLLSNMFQASPPSPVRPSFMSYSPPPSSSLSSCWSPTMDDEDEDDSMESAARFSPPPPPAPVVAPVQKKIRPPFVPRRPRNTGNLSPSRPGAGIVPSVPRRFPSMLKREASNASFLDNYPASLAPDEPSPSRLSPPSVTPASTAALTVPRMSTLPCEASASLVLQSIPPFLASPNTTSTPPPALLSSSLRKVPLLRKSSSDIPLRSLQNNNRRNNNENSFWLDAQNIVPQFKKSASFNDEMDLGNKKKRSSFLNEDVIMTLAPLFPLQDSTGAAGPKTPITNTATLTGLLSTPPDSQLV
ncbi:hypothetical protein BGX33_006433 [Mortierella sp. NVP41]|nr:hypothetical protein BGX33_006433 [Mortierella sp. NVP41]